MDEKTPRLSDVCEYLEEEFDTEDIVFCEIEGYKIIDTRQFN